MKKLQEMPAPQLRELGRIMENFGLEEMKYKDRNGPTVTIVRDHENLSTRKEDSNKETK